MIKHMTESDWIYENYPNDIIIEGVDVPDPKLSPAFVGLYTEKYNVDFKVHYDVWERAKEERKERMSEESHLEWLDKRKSRFKG